MRALLIVNPHATSTTQLRRDVIASALSSAVELEVVQTRYRGHATGLAAAARTDGFGLVLTLGGDGTVNEAVNGLLGAAGGSAGVPALAALPGGNANVFTRAVGLPPDPVDAAGQILQALAERRCRSIGVGLAGDRYFTFNAGLGLDAEVVRAVNGHRALGGTVTTALYLRMTLRQFFQVTDRRRPALMLERRGYPPDGPLYLGIVSNTAQWTYLGRHPLYASPLAAFDSGLDLLGLRSLGTVSTARAAAQMLSAARAPRGRGILALHDQDELALRSSRPMAFQTDGEYMGEHEFVRFRSVPGALRVYA